MDIIMVKAQQIEEFPLSEHLMYVPFSFPTNEFKIHKNVI